MRQINRTPTSLYVADQLSLDKTLEHFAQAKR
jgi:hypothetical protein